MRAWSGRELWPGTGNRESLRRTFLSRDSVLLWMIQSYGRMKERYAARMNDPAFAHISFVRLKSPREAREFLRSLESSVRPPASLP
jgi:hypothetical protein